MFANVEERDLSYDFLRANQWLDYPQLIPPTYRISTTRQNSLDDVSPCCCSCTGIPEMSRNAIGRRFDVGLVLPVYTQSRLCGIV
jgi:hypothetical protein